MAVGAGAVAGAVVGAEFPNINMLLPLLLVLLVDPNERVNGAAVPVAGAGGLLGNSESVGIAAALVVVVAGLLLETPKTNGAGAAVLVWGVVEPEVLADPKLNAGVAVEGAANGRGRVGNAGTVEDAVGAAVASAGNTKEAVVVVAGAVVVVVVAVVKRVPPKGGVGVVVVVVVGGLAMPNAGRESDPAEADGPVETGRGRAPN